MRPSLTQAVLDMMSFSPCGCDGAGAIGRLHDRDWQRTLRWLDRSGLALYFWRRVQEAGIEDVLPSLVRAALDRRQAENVLRTSAIVRERKRIQELADSVNVRLVMLKALALVPDYCPDPSLRVQFDHDCLVDRNSWRHAGEVFERAGYYRRGIDEAGQILFMPPAPRLGNFCEPLDFYSARLPRPVELHLELWDSNREGVSFELPGDFISRSTLRTWEGTSFKALCAEDALLFELLHAFRHMAHNWCRLSAFYEISYFLNGRRADKSFWEKFWARIESNLPLRRVSGVVLNLAESVFDAPDPVGYAPTEYFDLTPQLQLWLDRYGRRAAVENFSRDKSSLFLLREFATDRATWREVRRRRLFPLQLPHRMQIPRSQKAHSSWLETCRYASRVAGRFWFHGRAVALYALESLRWRVWTWRNSERLTSSKLKIPFKSKEGIQHRRGAGKLNALRPFRSSRDSGAN